MFSNFARFHRRIDPNRPSSPDLNRIGHQDTATTERYIDLARNGEVPSPLGNGTPGSAGITRGGEGTLDVGGWCLPKPSPNLCAPRLSVGGPADPLRHRSALSPGGPGSMGAEL